MMASMSTAVLIRARKYNLATTDVQAPATGWIQQLDGCRPWSHPRKANAEPMREVSTKRIFPKENFLSVFNAVMMDSVEISGCSFVGR